MTVPAAALLPRPTPRIEGVREAGQPVHQAAQQATALAQDLPANGGFAAHLERGTAPPAAGEPSSTGAPASEIGAVKPAPVRLAMAAGALFAAPNTEPPAEPPADAAIGKTVPDNRQTPAHPATQTVLILLAARGASDADEPGTDAAKPEAEAETTVTSTNPDPVAPFQVAAQLPAQIPAQLLNRLPTMPAATVIPASAMQQRPAPSAKVALSASTGTSSGTSSGTGTAPVVATADPVANSISITAPPASAWIAVPAVSFVFEHAGPVAGLPDPAAAANPDAPQPAADQMAAKPQPSTLAALTGPATPARPALRKARAETEAALPGPASNAAELTASALSLAQTPVGSASASSASAQPAASGQPTGGIGFDALVDSIARARDGAAAGAPVAIAMHHAEFGRVSLRFQSDGDGLSVAMTSPDPAFAPAVAAAHAAEAASADAPPRAAPAASTSSPASYSSGSQMQDGARSGTGQRQDTPQPPRASAQPSRTASRSPETSADGSRSGIFA